MNAITTTNMQTFETLEARRFLSAGLLDATFGTAGKLVTTIPGNTNATALSVVALSDAKLLVAAGTLTDNGASMLLRYLPSGQLDAQFGVDGVAALPSGSSVVEAAVQSDGRIVVLSRDMHVTRYLTSGQIDTSFGLNGTVAAWVGPEGSTCRANDLIVLPDNRLWVAGKATYPVATTTAYALALGMLSEDGLVAQQQTHDLIAGFREDLPVLARQPDGKILIGCALIGDTPTSGDSIVLRFLDSGVPDVTFGGGDGDAFLGRRLMTGAIGVQSDGSIVVAGSIPATPPFGYSDFCFTRLTPAGELDTSFGSGGFTTFDGGAFLVDHINAMTIDATDRIVAAGVCNAASSFSDFALIRLTATGQRDMQFGNRSIIRTDLINSEDQSHDMAALAGDRVILVGSATTQSPFQTRVALAQFLLSEYAMSAPSLTAADDTGLSNSDEITSVTSPRFDLNNAQAGATVTLYRDGVAVTVASDVPGGFSQIADAGPLADDLYVYTVQQVASDGTIGPMSAPTTVKIDTTRPIDVEHGFSFGAPMTLAVRWNEDTIFNPSELILENTTSSQIVPPSMFTGTYDTTTYKLTITFSGFRNGVLPNGAYVATFLGTKAMDRAGNTMASDSVITYRVLAGDADGNGVVDFTDYSMIDFGFNAGLSGWSNGDFDGNGMVDFDDYGIIDFAFNSQNGPSRILGATRHPAKSAARLHPNGR